MTKAAKGPPASYHSNGKSYACGHEKAQDPLCVPLETLTP